MRLVLLMLLSLTLSCVQKVEKPRELKTYYPPVDGKVQRVERGLLIRTECGKYVRAVEGGKVLYSGKDVGGYGWVVVVEQEDQLLSVYGGMDSSWVKTGERVKVRQVVGKVGKNREGCGLYYELRSREGNPLEPAIRW